MYALTTQPPTGGSERGERVVRAQSSVMRSPHNQLTGGGGERQSSPRLVRANQVYALATHRLRWMRGESVEQSSDAITNHQLQVERRESHRDNQVYALTTHQLQVGGEERVVEPIKCMRSPHTSYRWRRRESRRANQVYALTTHQLQVERRERHRANQVYALTTHQLQVERRERERWRQSSGWRLLGGHD